MTITSSIGASVDRGRVNFKAASELGIIGPDLFVTGTGVIVTQPDGSVAPANLKTSNTYFGCVRDRYVRPDVAAFGDRRGRFNLAQIKLEDQLGTALNGSHQFMRFNPVVGTTYKFTPQFNAYAGYSEANRAPTPAELACADPARPCLLDNFLVSDPPLKQVVARTYEAGLRGHHRSRRRRTVASTWNVGAFHTDLRGRHHSRRQHHHRARILPERRHDARRGIEASATYRSDRWNAYASYNYIDATFQDIFTLNVSRQSVCGGWG